FQLAQDVATFLNHCLSLFLGVWTRRVQQSLHALWIGLPDRLGQLPAVLALDWPEQPAQVAGAPLADLPPIEEPGEVGVERPERHVPRVGAARRLLDQLHGCAGRRLTPSGSSEAVVLRHGCAKKKASEFDYSALSEIASYPPATRNVLPSPIGQFLYS